ncbi:MAG: hypothetical protein HPY83_13830 [Anaerolineae bacterium]|nr:hypothetical protein [Anaerolineae bacterium]
MRGSNPLYGLLFLLVIGVAVVAGYVVASSVRIGPLRPPDILAHLSSPTPTPGRVEARLVTPSPTGDHPEADATPAAWPTVPLPTERPAPTVIVPTFAPAPTATSGSSSLGPTAAQPAEERGTPTPAATGQLEPPSPTPTRPAYLFVPAGAPTMAEDRGCFVGAVFGYVKDERGNPLPGVQLRVYDPWNHNFPAITKQPPDTGYYDVILGTGPATYYVVVVDSLGNQISPVVEVQHREGAKGCWYQVDFLRTRPQ